MKMLVKDDIRLMEPSLENLSTLLRHKECWPNNFSWYFWDIDRCGVGLAAQVWGDNAFTESLEVHSVYDVAFSAISYDVDVHNVTPDMVADRIDNYLDKKRE